MPFTFDPAAAAEAATGCAAGLRAAADGALNAAFLGAGFAVRAGPPGLLVVPPG